MPQKSLNIAMLCVHSSPVGDLGRAYTGGMSVYVRELAAALAMQGHRVDVFTRHAGGGTSGPSAVFDQTALADGVRLICLPVGPPASDAVGRLYPHLPQFIDGLRSFVAADGVRYDLVHSHYWLSGVVGQHLRKAFKIPHVMTFHTLGKVKVRSGSGEPVSSLRLTVEHDLVRDCDCLLVPSRRERQNLMHYYGAADADIRTVSCGVNLDRFVLQDRARCRRTLGLAATERIVLFVGRFAPVKGLDTLMEVLGHLAADSRIRLILVGGDGPRSKAHRQLLAQARDQGIESRVCFAGRVPQERLPSYYGAADLLAMPSHYESFGLVALESLACGTPVVSTDVGDMRDLIQDGRTGYVVDVPRPAVLADRMTRILAQSNGLLAPEGIRRTVAHLDWEAVAHQVGRVYEQVTERANATNSIIEGTRRPENDFSH